MLVFLIFFLFFLQTSDAEEPWLRRQLQDQAIGAEGRLGEREGQGVRRL